MSEQLEKKASEEKQASQEKEEADRQERVQGQRRLIIHVLLMFFVSIVVFVIGSYFFIVPRVVRHRLDAQQTASEVSQLRQQVNALGQALEQALAAPAMETDKPAPATAEPPIPASTVPPAKAAAPDEAAE